MTDFTHRSMLTGTSALAATALTSSIGQIWEWRVILSRCPC